tara:strand:- start:125 stop:958 length:834 start_codon:yes stop_codon:yes gene_type:complete
MINDKIRYLKKPKLLFRKILSFFLRDYILSLMDMISRVEAPRFLFYFLQTGSNLQSIEKASKMATIISETFSYPIKAIEVGSWFGEGSTSIWLKQLPKNSQLLLIDSWKKFGNKDDLKIGKGPIFEMDKLVFPAFFSTANIIRNYERKDGSSEVIIIRGEFGKISENFSQDLFDFLYLDGSHYYEDINQDIINAKKLCNKEFSLICGDDLYKHPSKELVEYSKLNLNKDFCNKQKIHPGVLLAVYENFGDVNIRGGFWWTYCINGVFTNENNNINSK